LATAFIRINGFLICPSRFLIIAGIQLKGLGADWKPITRAIPKTANSLSVLREAVYASFPAPGGQFRRPGDVKEDVKSRFLFQRAPG
jgi:hypothetical protein